MELLLFAIFVYRFTISLKIERQMIKKREIPIKKNFQ